MQERPIVAIMYDFDKTLSPRDMQEYAFIPGVGMEPDAFWAECRKMMQENCMDQILAYMYVMLQKARGKMPLTREAFHTLGRSVQLFLGVDTWFDRVNRYADRLGLTTEHYIISSGLKEIIEGTAIADCFKRIYAAEFLYDGTGAPVWPAMAVNYTSKTQFLYRINKGVLGVTQNEELNRHTPHNTRRVPFTNMMYLGDGLTDVPCMKLTKSKGGHSIAVYQGKRDRLVNDMLVQGRVDFAAPADYREDGLLETIVFSLLDQLAPQNRMDRIAASQLDEAQAAIIQEDRLAFRDAPD